MPKAKIATLSVYGEDGTEQFDYQDGNTFVNRKNATNKVHIMDLFGADISIDEVTGEKNPGTRFRRNNVYGGRRINDIKFKNGDIVLVTRGGEEKTVGQFEKELEDLVKANETLPPASAATKKGNYVDFEAITNKILGAYPEKIRVQGLKKIRPESLEKFLEDFFTRHNLNKDTIFAVSKEVQTAQGKRRSLGDIFMIVRYYYPDASLKQVVNILQAVLPKKIKGMRSSWCKVIKKRTYYYDPEQATGVFDTDKEDEYGVLYNNYLK